ncbi:hypothetical protein CDV36_005155 [Fusarium kuroshium]|uniref:Phosphoribosyltransferase domain-containing protein n=2 Tax=Fusarium solani species complex TaxID=232080 RepID=A0A3M2SC61_9HYPO|nr:hypothetical protein CDV36_005155 [Fusarium kuroshium]RSL69832.1 hypothetical protein CEP51_012289 [Fusarium floridanum]
MESASDRALLGISTVSQASDKPIVIGLYGISGSGKSFVMSHLKNTLYTEYYEFYEGSEVIASLVPGGLEAFQALDEQQKTSWRARAIKKIKKKALRSDKISIVTGHFMFWSEGETAGQTVYTLSDLYVFTHIIYLKTPAEHIFQYRLDDKLRNRPLASVEHLHKWQEAEVDGLRHLCPQHGILFHVLTDPVSMCNKARAAVKRFLHTSVMYDEENKLTLFNYFLDEVDNRQLETALVLDADRTLAPMDAGVLFWQNIDRIPSRSTSTCPLKELFGGPLGYTDKAFHQANLLYEEAADDDDEFDALCETAASSVVMYPEIVSLLRAAAEHKHVFSVVVTCGIRRVWEKVLEKEGLSSTVKVLGGGRISDGFVVLPATKADIVAQLREVWNLYTWVFGDSPLDIPMLRVANEAIVVVGEEQVRSSSMDAVLAKALEHGQFNARQALLPGHVSHRLDQTKLPLVRLDDSDFVESVLRKRFEVLHATEKCAAKLLMSPMRDASVAGPALRAAHQRVGLYLANEFVSQLIGVEEYPIPHVQGSQTSGYRLNHEKQTSVVALMRGGEPMAYGVSEAFPAAMFIHAASASDIKDHHLQNQSTVILVDSVVNSGKSLTEFVSRIRTSHPRIRIVIVAGVVQAEVTDKTHDWHRLMRSFGVSLVALRLSKNKFTGTKSTDTGNRLFNTTHSP